MFSVGQVVDGKYQVAGICSNAGGMGGVLFVTPLQAIYPFALVLKYCRSDDENNLKRFRREVRLLLEFQNSPRVVQIVDNNLDAAVPYFVMRYYPEGDLNTLAAQLQEHAAFQETTFLEMIDSVQVLHSRHVFHRDIKPANFLRNGSSLVVSDFGLSTELQSVTAFTSTTALAGTPGYLPPEFWSPGGFKQAGAAGDIYMLGKSFYTLLSGRDPHHYTSTGIPPSLFRVIDRSCNENAGARFRSLAELRQALVRAYDILLHRTGSVLEETFSALLAAASGTDVGLDVAKQFVDQLTSADQDEQEEYIKKLPRELFISLADPRLSEALRDFLSVYRTYIEGQDYAFAYAETVALSLKWIVDQPALSPVLRTDALDLAIRAASYMNRFDAMTTCRNMVKAIEDPEFASHVAPLLLGQEGWFLAEIDPSSCRSDIIRSAVRTARNAHKNSST